MRLAAVRALVAEARELRSAIDEEPEPVGAVAVSGMLAEQLARELGRGAEPGAVRVRGGMAPLREGDVAVHVFAGDPSEEDVAYVRSAGRLDVPVVLVQLWPQEEWTGPFVLSPFVVECRPGAGFPIAEIAARLAEAVGTASALADRVPALQDAAERRAIREAVARAGVVGALGGRGRAARPLITLEQARLLARLRPLPDGVLGDRAEEAAAAGTVAALEAWSFLLRDIARRVRSVVPSRVADAAIAVAGTWALAGASRALRERLGRDEI